jgi:hypothetical protein
MNLQWPIFNRSYVLRTLVLPSDLRTFHFSQQEPPLIKLSKRGFELSTSCELTDNNRKGMHNDERKHSHGESMYAEILWIMNDEAAAMRLPRNDVLESFLLHLAKHVMEFYWKLCTYLGRVMAAFTRLCPIQNVFFGYICVL